MNKEELLFKNRLLELHELAKLRYSILFTDFLNLNELNIVYTIIKEFPSINCKFFGGYEFAERQMVAFIPDALSCDIHDFPMVMMKAEPVHPKFSDQLSHRDFLGAILNLGIDRSKTGDILVQDNKAYIFCSSALSDFLLEELKKVKHTNIKTMSVSFRDMNYQPEFEEIRGSVSSVRLDSVLSFAYSISRGQSSDLIMAGRVFVNSRQIYSNSYMVKEDDIISVKGKGKFIFSGILNQTKKGRQYIELLKYK